MERSVEDNLALKAPSMRETTSSAMPACFDRWCQKFDDCFKTIAQKREFRHYVGGLLGESERKNITQMANNSVDVVYHRLHHFVTEAKWSVQRINNRRLEVMNKCNQTRITKGFAMIVDDSGHRKSGNFTDGVGRQYLGEIGKTDNGLVAVTTHLYDGKKSLPLDLEIYQKADDFEQGKNDRKFRKKSQIAIELIDRSLARGYRPRILLTDAGYGNNSSFLADIEQRKLKYLAGVAKNRKVKVIADSEVKSECRLDEVAHSLSRADFHPVRLDSERAKALWVATFTAQIGKLNGLKTFAIVMNANDFEQATDIDYFITNVDESTVTAQWVVDTYTQRNWVEVFYRDAKCWLGLREYQVRDKSSLEKHFVLVLCAYTFILWHKLTGGFRRRWAHKPLTSFAQALEAFRTSMSFLFFDWLTHNRDVFAAYKASLGFIWS